jgi:hypothetical protein
MDPVTAFGVATGVIGLIPLCGQGFDFVSSVFSAKQDLNDCALELDVERRKYIAWRTTLGLEGVPERDAPGVLKRKIPEGQHDLVLGCLVGISNAFANAKFLESCGFRQTNDDVHDGHSVSVNTALSTDSDRRCHDMRSQPTYLGSPKLGETIPRCLSSNARNI